MIERLERFQAKLGERQEQVKQRLEQLKAERARYKETAPAQAESKPETDGGFTEVPENQNPDATSL